MINRNFPEANLTLGPPQGSTESEIGSISAYYGQQPDGTPFYATVWQPSYEDIQAFQAGRPLVLHTLGAHFPPVALFTMDESGNPNC